MRNEVTAEELQTWFQELKKWSKSSIFDRNIYNMDETGFNIDDAEEKHVIVDTNVESRY